MANLAALSLSLSLSRLPLFHSTGVLFHSTQSTGTQSVWLLSSITPQIYPHSNLSPPSLVAITSYTDRFTKTNRAQLLLFPPLVAANNHNNNNNKDRPVLKTMEKYAKLLDKEEQVVEEWIKVTVVILAAVEDDHLLEPRNFRIKKSTKLINLKREYSYRVGYPPHSFRFYFGDRKIANSDTPQSIGMGEGDTVVAIRKHGCTLL